jgi:hypothetical protein
MTNIPIKINGNTFNESRIIHYNEGNTLYFIIKNNNNEQIEIDFIINDVKVENTIYIEQGQTINRSYPIDKFSGRKITLRICKLNIIGKSEKGEWEVSWICPNNGRIVVELNLQNSSFHKLPYYLQSQEETPKKLKFN